MSIGNMPKKREDAERRAAEASEYGLPYDPRQPLPWRRAQRHEFVRRMAAEASLMWGDGCRKMAVSLSGKPLAPDANPAKDPDVVSTSMSYRVTYSFREKGAGRLTERAFLIECDVLRPSKSVRVRSWEELVGYSKGMFSISSVRYDMETVRWMLAFTQISRELFLCAEANPGMPIPFSVDWARYIRLRNEQDPGAKYRLRTLSIDSVERIRQRFRARFEMQLGFNRAFVLQHSFSDRTSMWFRKKTLTQREEAELAGMDGPKRYPADYSDLEEAHRLTLFGANRSAMKIQKGKM